MAARASPEVANTFFFSPSPAHARRLFLVKVAGPLVGKELPNSTAVALVMQDIPCAPPRLGMSSEMPVCGSVLLCSCVSVRCVVLVRDGIVKNNSWRGEKELREEVRGEGARRGEM